MILTEAIEKGQHLGTEFLTWLWYISENGSSIGIADGRVFTIALDSNINLQHATDRKDRVTIVGDTSEYREGIAALKEGKVPTKARFILSHKGYSFEATIDATMLGLKSLKIVSGEFPAEDSDSMDAGADFMDRMAVIGVVWDIIDALFAYFMNIRKGQVWHDTVRQIQGWIKEAA